MPLSRFQKEILALLASHRNPDSYIAGAAAIHALPESPRYSQDIDVFHDAQESVSICANADADALAAAGFTIEWTFKSVGVFRGLIGRRDESMKMEWVQDTAFRFFPVEEDPVFGYRLHRTDLAVNKILALAGRMEPRDLVDVLYLHETHLSVAAMSWAASGKDPGLTPELLLNEASRHAIVRPEQIASLQLTKPASPIEIKKKWLEALAEARLIVDQLPTGELGCLYLNAAGIAVTPPLDSSERLLLTKHFGSVRGTWPRPLES